MNNSNEKHKNSNDLNPNVILNKIKNEFLTSVPFRYSSIKNQVEFVAENQNKILNKTVSHKLNKKFPVKKSFQIDFLKNIIRMLESINVEVNELVYKEYLKLLNTKDSDIHFSHFFIGNKYISIKGKGNIISDGTTGLVVWEAAKILAHYCVKHKELFYHKEILELGCGLGLNGIAALLYCKPKQYYFTDVHDEVLEYLLYNISQNLNEKFFTKFEKHQDDIPKILLNGMYGLSNVTILNFAWETLKISKIDEIIKPDLILAADVIYDLSTFHSLINVLVELLKKNEKSRAILSCTIRNISTLEAFLNHMHKYNLQEFLLTSVETWSLNFDYKCEVKIFSVQYLVIY